MKYAVVFAVILLVALTAELGECTKGHKEFLSGLKRRHKSETPIHTPIML